MEAIEWREEIPNYEYEFPTYEPFWHGIIPPYRGPQPTTGWICPKCGAVMAPTQPYCVNCTEVKFTTTVSC